MVKILIAGDYVPHGRVENLIDSGKYDEVFGEVIHYTSQVDYSIVNLEAPVVESDIARPIVKNGPNLKCGPKAIDAIKSAGFDMLTLANNHFYDYGEDGVRDTINVCVEREIEFVGGGENLGQAGITLYKEVNGIRFAFINCCENEFSIASETRAGSNPMNPIKQFYSIQEARRQSDFVIVITHGGPEYYQYPTPRMKDLYRFYIDTGADVVVNHHQHCYSGYEEYKGRLIFYGLGNFCFDYVNQKKTNWNEGYMIQLTFDHESIGYKLIPYIQGFKSPGVQFMDQIAAKDFENFITECNATIQDDARLENLYQAFCNRSSNMYLSSLEPYSNKYLRVARSRGLIPSFLSKVRSLIVMNYIACESHRDRFLFALRQKCK